jgi:hypothetical protein
MPPSTSRRLVIDASIAHSAGESGVFRATACRELLVCVLSVGHRVVMTAEIVVEWEKHRSRYASAWLVKMTRLQKIEQLEPGEHAALRGTMQDITSDVGILRAMLKDLHLIEAALAADRIVISLDEKARGHFSNVSAAVDELKQILWANPVLKQEKVVIWLENGANMQKSRLLGYRRR